MYPVLASYKAYDGYARLAAKSGATTIQVKGMTIPLGTMLKKATTSEALIEEDTLQFRLLSVQMWVIYWITAATVTAAERFFLLRALPFYSLIRLGTSIWLVYPLVLSTHRVTSAQALSTADIKREWTQFATQGCGYVYFVFLKPFLDDHLSQLNMASAQRLVSLVQARLPHSVRLYLSTTPSATGTSKNTYFQMAADYARGFGKDFKAEASATNMSYISEYDVVDKPDALAPEGLRERVPSADAASQTPERKTAWFWSH